ncbi:hypothetical protein SAICODRAFT_186551 [Saitoella complicata NRRL Y-17804]|uniref:uncharacterized protein n=1 Tax=Saitoella complicata (strain BCRC 22490 / CBS 7301 / JCM 7358 / NBRC 10748 / NRRL Y-17804) TaxID=698492 RepID=UPI0008674BA9|nr:uncharacterized protein SAICODRAFT_186551 [Saitoella complicata NRRL Y-17804]ODQ55524.1 hypothetical protein SAICODRAFT_186551 [Saitoella complicata NRRL Y-17804]
MQITALAVVLTLGINLVAAAPVAGPNSHSSHKSQPAIVLVGDGNGNLDGDGNIVVPGRGGAAVVGSGNGNADGDFNRVSRREANSKHSSPSNKQPTVAIVGSGNGNLDGDGNFVLTGPGGLAIVGSGNGNGDGDFNRVSRREANSKHSSPSNKQPTVAIVGSGNGNLDGDGNLVFTGPGGLAIVGSGNGNGDGDGNRVY